MSLFNLEDELDNFDKELCNLINENNMDEYKAGKLKISIMSATSNYNTIINLKALSLELKKTDNIYFIDSTFNMTRKISNISKKKIFYNQITIKIRPYYKKELKINLNLSVNLKLFRNGKLQLCGLRSENDGYLSLKILEKELNKIIKKELITMKILKEKLKEENVKKIIDKLFEKNIYLLDYDGINNIEKKNIIKNKILRAKYEGIMYTNIFEKLIEENSRIIKLEKYNITLINSDFYVGFKVDRVKVHNFMLNECNLFSDFDPCIYQGVLVKFYWNNSKEKQDGICNCNVPCNGKGIGIGEGNCKKITISIFQSGYIIITGKTTRTEINYIYNYVVKLFKENINKLRQIMICNKEEKFKRRNISILIKKN